MGQQHKDKKMKVGVLISGSGTNLQALIDQSLRQDSSAKIVLVISNVPGVQGLSRAEAAGIPTKVSVWEDYWVLCCTHIPCRICCQFDENKWVCVNDVTEVTFVVWVSLSLVNPTLKGGPS